MKSWKAMGLFFLVLVVSGLIFGCSDDPPPFYAGSGGGGKYQVKYQWQKDERGITEYKEQIKTLEDKVKEEEKIYKERLQQRGPISPINWAEVHRRELQSSYGKLEELQKQREWLLKIEIRGPAAELRVMVLQQNGEMITTEKISREDMMDNIEKVDFKVWEDKSKDELKIDYKDIKPGVYSLVVKTFEPEKIVYKAKISLPNEEKP